MTAKTQNPKTILIADDTPADVQRLHALICEAQLSNSIQVVANGADTIAYLAGKEQYGNRELYPYPTLLFLDLVMPFQSGLDVLRWLQSRPEPEHKKLGVVIMTGVGNIQEIQTAYRLGAHSFLVKPLVKEDFINLINSHIGMRMESLPEGKQVSFDTGFFTRSDWGDSAKQP
jgi:CheY-like chemotaxis protein